MNSLRAVKNATRRELVAYLESWGTACYSDESTGLLREAAIDTFKTEGCQDHDNPKVNQSQIEWS